MSIFTYFAFFSLLTKDLKVNSQNCQKARYFGAILFSCNVFFIHPPPSSFFNQLVSSSESQLLIELSDPTSIPHPFKFASLAGAEALSASFCRNKTCIAGHLTTGYRLFSLEFQLSCSPCSPPWPQFTSPAGESFSSCNWCYAELNFYYFVEKVWFDGFLMRVW